MFSECHCHLRSPSENATQQTIREAEKRGVELVLDAGIDIASSELAIQNASTYPIVKACVGIHPWNSDQYSGETLDSLRTLASKAHVVAISEIGLDYVGRRDRTGTYVNDYADKSIQQNSFRGQLRLAKELQLPVVVHDRTSTQEVLDILHEEGNAETGAVIHGFSKECIRQKMHGHGHLPLSRPQTNSSNRKRDPSGGCQTDSSNMATDRDGHLRPRRSLNRG